MSSVLVILTVPTKNPVVFLDIEHGKCATVDVAYVTWCFSCILFALPAGGKKLDRMEFEVSRAP